MFSGVTCLSRQPEVEVDMERCYLVGFVDREAATSLGRLTLKAPRQLMVRGTCT
jgi:hypothetical protein